MPEWEILLAAVERDHALTAEESLAPIKDKIVSIRLPGASVRMVCALENLNRIAGAFLVPDDTLDIRDLFTDERVKHSAYQRQFMHGSMSRSMTRDEKTASAESGTSTSADDRVAQTGEEESVLSDIFSQWLSFYGPVRFSRVREMLGLAESMLEELLSGLVETESVIVDLLTEEAQEPQMCDRENLEILLRMARRARQPTFRALSIHHLPTFLAAWQGLIEPGEAASDLQDRLDQLFGYPAHADAWEKHILPARISPYYSSWLDSLMQTSALKWFGCGKRKLSFAFADDLELFIEQDASAEAPGNRLPEGLKEELSRLFPSRTGRYSLFDIAQFSKSDTRTVGIKLWELVWQGLVTNDTVAALRQGILTDFAPVGLKDERGRRLRPTTQPVGRCASFSRQLACSRDREGRKGSYR